MVVCSDLRLGWSRKFHWEMEHLWIVEYSQHRRGLQQCCFSKSSGLIEQCQCGCSLGQRRHRQIGEKSLRGNKCLCTFVSIFLINGALVPIGRVGGLDKKN